MIREDVIRGRGKMRGTIAAAIVAILVSASPSYGQKAKLIKQFSGWTAYSHDSATNKVCFVVAKPTRSTPKRVRRGPILFYVSHWPGDTVRNEISVKIGYPFKPGVAADLTVGKEKFKLFTKGEGAFVKEAVVEQQIVEAMKKGSLMVVQGRSKRGTLTTDRYSLKGITAALNAIENCNK